MLIASCKSFNSSGVKGSSYCNFSLQMFWNIILKFTIIGCKTPRGSKNIARTFNTFRLVGSKVPPNLRIFSNSNFKRLFCSSQRIPKIFVGFKVLLVSMPICSRKLLSFVPHFHKLNEPFKKRSFNFLNSSKVSSIVLAPLENHTHRRIPELSVHIQYKIYISRHVCK